MKYILLVPDGAADDPLSELDGMTPLEAARTPNLDRSVWYRSCWKCADGS